MGSYFKEFFTEQPEQIIEWHDTETEAVGWLVFNSLRGGAAGGGTRMKFGCTLEEVINLAKVMEIKFAISGPLIGGAKSGINYVPKNQKEKHGILRRWFNFIEPHLKNRYGTGGDYNIDQTKDVMPLLRELGIEHPQEGIVRGHLGNLTKADQDKIIKQLHHGVKLSAAEFVPDHEVTVADLATGFGVIEALREYCILNGNTIEGKRIIIEGFGNVGGAAAYCASKAGAKVVEIIEKGGNMYDNQGLNVSMLYRQARKKGIGTLSFVNMSPETMESVRADAYIPAATSGTITSDRLKILQDRGVEIIVCGANNPFDSIETLQEADSMFAVIPDFVANAGMARTFAYLMQLDITVESSAILEDISYCVRNAVREIYQLSLQGRYFYAASEKMVLNKLKQNNV